MKAYLRAVCSPVVLLLLALLVLLFWVSPAPAEESWVDQILHRRKAQKRAYVRPREVQQVRHGCLGVTLSVVGLEAYSLETARSSAIANWMEAVKLHHGVKYMNPEHAVSEGPACFLSTTGNRSSEKAGEFLHGGKSLHQCEFRARPCIGQAEK